MSRVYVDTGGRKAQRRQSPCRAGSPWDQKGIIERFRAEHGDKRVVQLERKHLQKLVSDKAATPAAANNMLRMVHLLMRHAVELGWRGDDPTQGVRKVRNKTEGFLTWEEDHIAAFEEHHKPGTRAHLALVLLLYTGQRRSDVVRMGRQHVRKGILSITQQKTGQDVHVPLHADLRAVLDSLPLDNLSFLMTAQGRPFTPPGFTNWFRDMVREAGLPDGLSPHGLRKATCRRLAEAGCTPHQIMAISGHKSLAEVTRYTVAAGRKDLAAQAMLALGKKEG
ncbi:tyrosine-type recombinase/integrase [Pseudogemmobacter bohemicus]|uniref:tyrosine-type recombinase/integrase n=1 Tax=Pseudogemmobacter bohemicus TaxID=2250708 RepID=UPI001300BC09|nr:tyrosine-type recombinase/integrase [Pseudogemmobacter bohemicus]